MTDNGRIKSKNVKDIPKDSPRSAANGKKISCIFMKFGGKWKEKGAAWQEIFLLLGR
jgi:hypothetical protein